jgi:hypothetical protein
MNFLEYVTTQTTDLSILRMATMKQYCSWSEMVSYECGR